MKISDLRVNDLVEYVNGNSSEYIRIVSIGDRLCLENLSIELDDKVLSHTYPIDIHVFEKAKLGFEKKNIPKRLETEYSDYFKCNLMGCTFELFRVRQQSDITDIEDIGIVECCKNTDGDESYGSWTMKCTCAHGIDGDVQVFKNLHFIHEIQHIMDNYVD